MKKINLLFKIVFVLTVFTLVSCEEEEYSLGSITAPTEVSLTAEIVGASADNPNGDGSGTVNFSVTGNATSLGLGSFTVTADANHTVTGNALTLATGNVTITGTALVNPTGSGLTLNTNEAGVITWNEIVPGANMVWTPIDPS